MRVICLDKCRFQYTYGNGKFNSILKPDH